MKVNLFAVIALVAFAEMIGALAAVTAYTYVENERVIHMVEEFTIIRLTEEDNTDPGLLITKEGSGTYFLSDLDFEPQKEENNDDPFANYE